MRCYVSGHFCNSFNYVVSQVGYKPVSFVQLFASKLDILFKSVIFIYLSNVPSNLLSSVVCC